MKTFHNLAGFVVLLILKLPTDLNKAFNYKPNCHNYAFLGGTFLGMSLTAAAETGDNL